MSATLHELLFGSSKPKFQKKAPAPAPGRSSSSSAAEESPTSSTENEQSAIDSITQAMAFRHMIHGSAVADATSTSEQIIAKARGSGEQQQGRAVSSEPAGLAGPEAKFEKRGVVKSREASEDGRPPRVASRLAAVVAEELVGGAGAGVLRTTTGGSSSCTTSSIQEVEASLVVLDGGSTAQHSISSSSDYLGGGCGPTWMDVGGTFCPGPDPMLKPFSEEIPAPGFKLRGTHVGTPSSSANCASAVAASIADSNNKAPPAPAKAPPPPPTFLGAAGTNATTTSLSTSSEKESHEQVVAVDVKKSVNWNLFNKPSKQAFPEVGPLSQPHVHHPDLPPTFAKAKSKSPRGASENTAMSTTTTTTTFPTPATNGGIGIFGGAPQLQQGGSSSSTAPSAVSISASGGRGGGASTTASKANKQGNSKKPPPPPPPSVIFGGRKRPAGGGRAGAGGTSKKQKSESSSKKTAFSTASTVTDASVDQQGEHQMKCDSPVSESDIDLSEETRGIGGAVPRKGGQLGVPGGGGQQFPKKKEIPPPPPAIRFLCGEDEEDGGVGKGGPFQGVNGVSTTEIMEEYEERVSTLHFLQTTPDFENIRANMRGLALGPTTGSAAAGGGTSTTGNNHLPKTIKLARREPASFLRFYGPDSAGDIRHDIGETIGQWYYRKDLRLLVQKRLVDTRMMLPHNSFMSSSPQPVLPSVTHTGKVLQKVTVDHSIDHYRDMARMHARNSIINPRMPMERFYASHQMTWNWPSFLPQRSLQIDADLRWWERLYFRYVDPAVLVGAGRVVGVGGDNVKAAPVKRDDVGGDIKVPVKTTDNDRDVRPPAPPQTDKAEVKTEEKAAVVVEDENGVGCLAEEHPPTSKLDTEVAPVLDTPPDHEAPPSSSNQNKKTSSSVSSIREEIHSLRRDVLATASRDALFPSATSALGGSGNINYRGGGGFFGSSYLFHNNSIMQNNKTGFGVRTLADFGSMMSANLLTRTTLPKATPGATATIVKSTQPRSWLRVAGSGPNWQGGLNLARGFGDVTAQVLGHTAEPDFFEFSAEDLQYLVVASDGVFDYVNEETQLEFFAGQPTAPEVIKLSRDVYMEVTRGSCDDITAVVLRLRPRERASSSQLADEAAKEDVVVSN
ncbi:unnamed protein product [Amoebophrya sp. A25]|nr:unnamed protein product [Amoebophrya sp. A25]|eukprot:GSA25T00004090001.1